MTFFIQDLNDFLALLFFYKIEFSLKISYVPFFAVFFCLFSFISPIACSVFPRENMAFLTFGFLKYEKLIF